MLIFGSRRSYNAPSGEDKLVFNSSAQPWCVLHVRPTRSKKQAFNAYMNTYHHRTRTNNSRGNFKS